MKLTVKTALCDDIIVTLPANLTQTENCIDEWVKQTFSAPVEWKILPLGPMPLQLQDAFGKDIVAYPVQDITGTKVAIDLGDERQLNVQFSNWDEAADIKTEVYLTRRNAMQPVISVVTYGDKVVVETHPDQNFSADYTMESIPFSKDILG